jgi:hypothetical protein
VKVSDVPFALRHSLANRGVTRSVRAVGRRMIDLLLRKSEPAKHVTLPHPFDAEFGTDTGGIVQAHALRNGSGRKSIYNTAYYGTPPSIFLQALARLEIDYDQFAFIDLGAGKGRVLLLASNFPFRQVIGVEFAEDLVVVANRNISLYSPDLRQCEDVRCIAGDASEFVFPPGPLVIFMWHPFVGVVFDRMLANLEQSLGQEPRQVYILYLNPECGQRVESCSRLKKVWECTLEMTEEDFAFYEIGDRTAPCAAYRSFISAKGPGHHSAPASMAGIA